MNLSEHAREATRARLVRQRMRRLMLTSTEKIRLELIRAHIMIERFLPDVATSQEVLGRETEVVAETIRHVADRFERDAPPWVDAESEMPHVADASRE